MKRVPLFYKSEEVKQDITLTTRRDKLGNVFHFESLLMPMIKAITLSLLICLVHCISFNQISDSMKIITVQCKTEPYFTAQYNGKVHPNHLLKIYYPYTRCVDIYNPIIYRGVSCSLPRCLSPERTCADCYFSC